MGEVRINIEGKLIPLRGKGTPIINKMLTEKVLPICVEQITADITEQSTEYAKGIDQVPRNIIAQPQADHKIGESKSGYILTGKLADSIRSSFTSKVTSIIEALIHYASYVEFGTYGGESPGQRPNPYFRGSIWFIKENLNPTIEKIQRRLKGN